MQPEPRMEALVGTVLEGAYRITRLSAKVAWAPCTRPSSFDLTSAWPSK